MISVIEDNCVEKKKWISHDEMMEITVIAESTPGPIAINCATFVGYRIAGFMGSLFATLGVVLPSFVIILIISTFLDNFLEIELVAKAFGGIKVGVGVLILTAGMNMLKKMSKKVLPRIIMASSLLIMLLINLFSWNFSSISMMMLAAIVSLVCFVVMEKKEGQKG